MKTKSYTSFPLAKELQKKPVPAYLLLLVFALTFVVAPEAQAQIEAMRSGNWNHPSTWRGGTVPSLTDDVIIAGKYAVTVNIVDAQCNNLQLGSGSSTGHGYLNFSGTSSLTVGNAITLGDVAGAQGTLTMGPSATLTAGKILEVSPDLSGNYFTDDGTIVFTGTFTLPNNLNNFNNLIINSGATTAGSNMLYIDGDLTVNNSATLDLKTAGVSRTSAGGTLQIEDGGNMKTAAGFPSNFSTHSIGQGSTFEYNALSGTQSVSVLNSSQNYGNLTISGSGTKRLAGSIGVSGNLSLSAGMLDTRTYSVNRTTPGGILTLLSGTTLRIQGNGTVPANFSTHVISTASTIDFRGSAQNVPALNSSQQYGNLAVAGSGTKSMTGSITVAGTLSFESGARLAVGSNTLTIRGDLVNLSLEGITGGTNSNLAFEGSGISPSLSMDQSDPGNTNVLRNLTLNASGGSLLLDNALRLTGMLSPQSGTLSSGGNLTLASSASGTASVSSGPAGGGYITGDVTVERYISSGRKWHLLSVATEGTQSIKEAWQEGQPSGGSFSTGYGAWITSNDPAALSLGFDYQSNTVSMKSYNPLTSGWTPTPNTTDPIATKHGYMIFIRGDRGCTSTNSNKSSTVLRTTGSLVQGNQDVISVGAGKYTAIGNPFPSAIDFKLASKSANVDDYYYVWDPRLSGSQGLGAYQTFTFNGSGYTPTPGGGSYGIDDVSMSNFIQSGQAFVVHTTGGTGTFQVPEGAKVSGSALVSRPDRPLQLSSIIRTRLYADSVSAETLLDGNLLEMDDIYSDLVDSDDARKLSNTGESIGIKNLNEIFSVERRSAFHSADTVFFNLTALKIKTYKLEIKIKDLLGASYMAVLQDNYTGIETPLVPDQPNLINMVTTSDVLSRAANRLRIVLRPVGVLPVKFIMVSVKREAGANRIDWKVADSRGVSRYSVERSTDGKNFHEIKSRMPNQSTGYSETDAQPASGVIYYRISAHEMDGSFVLSNVVRVNGRADGTAISLVSNPVKGREMNIRLEELPEGQYSLRLFNASGQTLMSKRFQHAGGNSVMKVDLPRKYGIGILSAEFRGVAGFRQSMRFIVE